jgi:hypothetical protein
MADALELTLDPNGEHIKLKWSKDDEPLSKPLRLEIELLRRRSRAVREALSELNSYVCTNQELEEEKDPGWRRYAAVVRKLRQRGQALRSALLNEMTRSQELLRAIESLRSGRNPGQLLRRRGEPATRVRFRRRGGSADRKTISGGLCGILAGPL